MLQLSPFASNCLFFTSFAIVTTLFGKLLLHIDINKRTYNHVPGECGVIPNLPGILGLTTSTTGRLYMTTNSKDINTDQTHLFTFYSDNRTAREIEIRGGPPKWRLTPGALSINSETSNPNVFVHNKRTNNIDVFETNEQNDAWQYRKTFKDEQFEGLTDISAAGLNSFFFVKSSIFGTNFALNIIERVVPIPTGYIYFVSGNNIQQISRVSFPTGIVYDSVKKSIFVTSSTRNSIYRMKVQVKNGIEIVSSKEYDLGCSPSSIWKDFDGSFLITCHPVKFRYLLSLFNVITSSPSLILRVAVPTDKDKPLTITQLYSNDGATISNANVTVRAGRSLLISDGTKILNCHL
ncbi:PON (paraoxonase) and MEC-6 Like [Caenorhabditis elegans]|uniref:PON (Paraoxonase) and MEC-6 Like n=1 Tax=Caenorhabditis elegans TaxID=6239 RepID=Q21427_CAEEL|nr:PON (paraoxonase) and MEC-6 Like [Caenorhabditis elegans]CAA94156.2 PON (paraoxonase) and MEC-6 Like [Caenorhabditis elegans]|eukprot:NP_510296.2 PON (paraoxonase) and MEC-6 Like [Caenorhabditis elegans]